MKCDRQAHVSRRLIRKFLFKFLKLLVTPKVWSSLGLQDDRRPAVRGLIFFPSSGIYQCLDIFLIQIYFFKYCLSNPLCLYTYRYEGEERHTEQRLTLVGYGPVATGTQSLDFDILYTRSRPVVLNVNNSA